MPGAGSTTCSSDLARRAVPCHVVVSAEGVSLLFMSTFWGRYVAARGAARVFLGLSAAYTSHVAGCLMARKRYTRGTAAVPILPRRYCRADTATRTHPADAACLGASVAGLLHWWDTLRYLAIPCNTLGYLVRHPAEACAWLCVGGVHRPCPTPGSACICLLCLLARALALSPSSSRI